MRVDIKNKMAFTPLPVLIIGTYDKEGKPNAMNAAWGGVCDFDKIMIALSPHKTTENILENKVFTVSFATKETVKISDYFGLVSGKNENKIEKANVKYEDAKNVYAPIFLDYPISIECEMISYVDEILIGKVLAINVDDKYLENGVINTSNINFIAYDMFSHTYKEVKNDIGKAFNIGKEIK